MQGIRFVAGIPATGDFATARAACVIAEAGGFDAFARPDHLLAEGVQGAAGAPLLECFTTIAALVPTTARLRFLPMVACASFRNPALLAKMVASLDVISNGRVDLGIGAGWLRREYDAYGYDFPPAAVRLEQLRETLQIVKRLWTGEPIDYTGTHHRLQAAVCVPRPVQRPAILVGGGGPGLLAVAAAEADLVNLVPATSAGSSDPVAVTRFTLARFREKARRVRALAEAAGRDPGSLVVSAIFFVRVTESTGEAGRLFDALAARYGIASAEAERLPLFLIGTPARLREQLAERISLLGLGHVVLDFPSNDALGRFAAEVLPAVRASGA